MHDYKKNTDTVGFPVRYKSRKMIPTGISFQIVWSVRGKITNQHIFKSKSHISVNFPHSIMSGNPT